MSQLVTINLSKQPGASWGFRLQGGKDFAQPLGIQKVNVGSVAEQAGVRVGDSIVSIGGTDALSLRHKEAQDAIVRAGNSFQLVVQRGSSLWKPKVTPLPQPTKTPQGPVATQTSLAKSQATKPQRAPKGFNATPTAFGEVNGTPIVNPQYNSPINLYNEDSIAEALSAQSEVLGKGCLGINFRKFDREVKLRTDSPTYQMIHGEGADDAVPKPRKQLPPQNEAPPAPKPVFPAPQPGQAGYYNVSDKLYCDVHAKQAAKHNPPGPNLVPVTVKPGAAPPPGAVAAPKAPAPAPAPAPVEAPAPPAPEEVVPAPASAPPQQQQQLPAAELATSLSPAPAPTPSQSSVAPGGSSANPAAFGAPSGGVNVRSHIPKKANKFVWPPRRAHSEESTSGRSPQRQPSWAPSGEALKVPLPVKPEGPPPKTIPLLPTPPPPKDYDSMVKSAVNFSTTSQQQQQQNSTQVIQKTTSTFQQQATFEQQTTVETKTTSKVSSMGTEFVGIQALTASAEEKSKIMKGRISPPKFARVTQPLPGGAAKAAPTKPSAGVAPSATSAQLATVADPLLGGIKKSSSVPGFKSVKAPVAVVKKALPSVGFKPVKFGSAGGGQQAAAAPAPTAAPAPKTPLTPPTPINVAELPFAVAPAPFAPILPSAPAAAPKKVVPKLGAKVAPKTAASSQPTKPPGTAPAPSFTAPKPAAAPTFAPAPKPAAPAPAPSFIAPKPAAAPAQSFSAPAPSFSAPKPAAPAPAPMFGGGGVGMPKPAPPPGLGGIGKPPGPGGPPTKGIPGERTAPKRGRGVMNPAVASRIPICASCQRQIRGPFVTALGKNWCPDHFHCATDSCRKPLIDVGFVEEQGSLYCEDCYEKYLAPTCGKCDKRIKGDCLNAVGKQFHPECFCCTYCGKVFGSGAFYLEDGLPYCETDWNDLFTTKCVGCGFPIEAGDRWVEALNNNYHSQCFKCSVCKSNLEGKSFYAKNGRPFCKSHAGR